MLIEPGVDKGKPGEMVNCMVQELRPDSILILMVAVSLGQFETWAVDLGIDALHGGRRYEATKFVRPFPHPAKTDLMLDGADLFPASVPWMLPPTTSGAQTVDSPACPSIVQEGESLWVGVVRLEDDWAHRSIHPMGGSCRLFF